MLTLLLETKNTIEGQVLDKLFDIIGELIPDTRLDELLKDAIFSQRSQYYLL